VKEGELRVDLRIKNLAMEWGSKYEQCESCRTTLFKYKSKGFCSKCFRIESAISKLADLSDTELKHRMILFSTPGSVTNISREAMITSISNYERQKLLYLKLYGELDNNQKNLDLVEIENIFNKVAQKAGNSKAIYTQKLGKLQTSFNEEQRIILVKWLLKLIV
jgi:hypothetical protein